MTDGRSHPVGTVERAFALARGGKCSNTEDLRRLLKAEGFEDVDQHLGGRALHQQLKAVLKASRAD
jgi:hypothetical protein